MGITVNISSSTRVMSAYAPANAFAPRGRFGGYIVDLGVAIGRVRDRNSRGHRFAAAERQHVQGDVAEFEHVAQVLREEIDLPDENVIGRLANDRQRIRAIDHNAARNRKRRERFGVTNVQAPNRLAIDFDGPVIDHIALFEL